MLSIGRKKGERVRIKVGGAILWLHVYRFYDSKRGNSHVALGFDGSREVEVMREECLPEEERYQATAAPRPAASATPDAPEPPGCG